MQVRTLIPQDRISFVTIGADKDGHTVNQQFLFDGRGQQLTNGEADGTLPALGLPASVFGRGQAQGPEPQFDSPQYVQLLRENKKQEADELSVAYKVAYDAYQCAGGVPLADAIIDACLQFVQANVPDLHVGDGGAEWNIVRDKTIVRVPSRATAETPVMIVVQPTPSWGN